MLPGSCREAWWPLQCSTMSPAYSWSSVCLTCEFPDVRSADFAPAYLTVRGETTHELLNAGHPAYVEIFMNATQSRGGATTLTTIVFILLLFGIINMVTTTSRQLYAFARDRGLPFSAFLSHVRPGWDIPLNAVTVTLVFSVSCSLGCGHFAELILCARSCPSSSFSARQPHSGHLEHSVSLHFLPAT